jgi:hypothetical protein
MAPFSGTDVIHLFEWYSNLKNRLEIITDVTPSGSILIHLGFKDNGFEYGLK